MRDVVQTVAPTSVDQSKLPSNATPMVIVFGEADGLLFEMSVEDEKCPLRCIQRACDVCGIVSIYLSTTSRIQRIHSSKASSRRPPRNYIEPFIDVVQHDLYRNHLFHLGRPMWRYTWENQCGEKYKSLVNFAESKLVGNFEANDAEYKSAMAAIFGLRFGMSPTSTTTDNFVSNHMAILTAFKAVEELSSNVSKSRFTGTSCWLSEPILAEASCHLTSFNPAFKRIGVLRRIKEDLDSNVVAPSVGDKGELLAATLFGFTMDVLREAVIGEPGNYYSLDNFALSMSASVSLTTFLKSIGLKLDEKLVNALEGYAVNFTHFQRLESVMDADDCEVAVRRCLAFYTLAGSAAVDIVIVGFKWIDNRLAFVPVRCQVKNLKQSITASAAEILLTDMSPKKKCQPRLLNSPVEIGIVMAIGAGGASHQQCAVINSESKSKHSTRQSTKFKLKDQTSYYGFLVDIHPDNNNLEQSQRFFPKLTTEELNTVNEMATSHTFASENDFRFKHGMRNYKKDVRIIKKAVSYLLQQSVLRLK